MRHLPQQPQQPQQPGSDRFVTTFLVRSCEEWMSPARDTQPVESPGGARSGGCVYGGSMNCSPSAWLRELYHIAVRSSTPPHGDRRPPLGRRITRCTSRQRSGRILLPCRQVCRTAPWTTTSHLPPAPGQTSRLSAVSGPQERVLRLTVEQMADSTPVVPMLEAPVQQLGCSVCGERARPWGAAPTSCSGTASARASCGASPRPGSAGGGLVRSLREALHSVADASKSSA